MSIIEVLTKAISWLAWTGLGLGVITLICFIFGWGIRFRLIGATVFTLLLSGSCWAFSASYKPPVRIDGSIYAPVVYDNGFDLVVAQASKNFPEEAIVPSLQQIAENLKGGRRNGGIVHIRLRKIEEAGEGTSKPIILGEIIRDVRNQETLSINTKINEPQN